MSKALAPFLKTWLFSLVMLLLISCSNQKDTKQITRFQKISSDSSGLTFTNKLTFDGNVKVSTPELQNATARQFVYDLATGRPKFTGLKSDAIDVSKKEKDAQP